MDTSAGTSLALVAADGETIAQVLTNDTMRHAELIGEFLAELRPEPTRLSGVVVGVGPGPFTGLRVGIAAARAYAWGAQLPLLPVLSHDAAALTCYRDGASGTVVITTDARRREFFSTNYHGLRNGVPLRDAAGPQIVTEPPSEPVTSIHAADLAKIAWARLAEGFPFDPADAVYLRSPDVTLRPVSS